MDPLSISPIYSYEKTQALTNDLTKKEKYEKLKDNFHVDYYSLTKLMNANEIPTDVKIKFLADQRLELSNFLKTYMGSTEYNIIVANRPLLAFQPLLNCFKKHGDNILLAKAMGVSPKRIARFVEEHTEMLEVNDQLGSLTEDQGKMLTTYVYRHGTQKQLTTFFNHELNNTTNLTGSLIKNLEYGNGGIADYFTRPIHKMTDDTMVNIYNTIFQHIQKDIDAGKLNEVEAAALTQWVIGAVINLQENSKFSNALKRSLKKEK